MSNISDNEGGGGFDFQEFFESVEQNPDASWSDVQENLRDKNVHEVSDMSGSEGGPTVVTPPPLTVQEHDHHGPGFGGGVTKPAEFTFPFAAAPTPTAEGKANWDSSTDHLKIGDGAATKTLANQSDKLSVFAATTSAELAGVISDETGTNKLVFSDNPALNTPTVDGYAVGMVRLADTTLSQAAASVDIQNIPTTFKHLRLEIYARTDRVATGDLVGVRFNNDSGGNYDSEAGNISHSAALVTAESLAGTLGFLGNCPASTAPANTFGAITLSIPHYAGASNYKDYHAEGHRSIDTTTGNQQFLFGGGVWKSIATITRITIISNNGANFAADTRVTLYGLN